MTFNGSTSPTAVRYRLIEDLTTLIGDFHVLNDAGDHAFKINGRSLINEDLIRLEDLGGNLLCQSSAHLARTKSSMAIVDRSGDAIGHVQRHPVSPLLDRFSIALDDKVLLVTEGNVSSLEFWMLGPDGAAAEISRRWFRARDSYGIAIAPGQPDAVLVAGVISIVQMARGTS